MRGNKRSLPKRILSRVALLSALLTLSFVITGCATSGGELPIAYPCDKPPLRGETWADVAILSVEQAAAIDVCNIRNGVDTYGRSVKAQAESIPATPTKARCFELGVAVKPSDRADGRIIGVWLVDTPELIEHCFAGEIYDGVTIGCAVEVAPSTWKIYYVNNAGWVREHEACHARYNQHQHTLNYLMSRKRVK